MRGRRGALPVLLLALSACAVAQRQAEPGLKDWADFPVGVAVSAQGDKPRPRFEDLPFRRRVARDFNLVVAENALKLRWLQRDFPHGLWNFHTADRFLCQARDAGLAVHGHTWVWYRDTVQGEGPSRHVVDAPPGGWAARLTRIVTAVATHFRGRLASVDVVNEAIEKDRRSGRYVLRPCAENGWACADRTDPIAWVRLAFQVAARSDPAPRRYYNDYDLLLSGNKRARLLALVREVNAERRWIQGIGLQGHLKLKLRKDRQELARKQQAIARAFRDMKGWGLPLRISELDVRIQPGGQDGLPVTAGEAAQQQAELYCHVLRAYLCEVPPDLRGGITFWGYSDRGGEADGSPVGPHLFDARLRPKPAYHAVRWALATFARRPAGQDCSALPRCEDRPWRH